MNREEEKSPTYIIYRRGRATVVGRAAWEQEWFRWWKRTHVKPE